MLVYFTMTVCIKTQSHQGDLDVMITPERIDNIPINLYKIIVKKKKKYVEIKLSTCVMEKIE